MTYLFFDLDGTLTDPFEGIANSIEHALRRMGKPLPERDFLRRFIGPPLIPSFREFLGMTAEEADAALAYYREYFSTRGLFENEPYPGIAEALRRIRAAGYVTAVATSKPEAFSRRILAHFGLAEDFDEICGASLDQSRTTKAEVIRALVDRLAERDGVSPEEIRHHAVMIGDRMHDAEGAALCGIPALGVLWGYGSREELCEAGCRTVFETPEDLAAHFCPKS
ncbi:MAG: HAD family hydrolase [Clostridiales bacterium]|nr:HAD family hydrolase [Clostridiales bacterium]